MAEAVAEVVWRESISPEAIMEEAAREKVAREEATPRHSARQMVARREALQPTIGFISPRARTSRKRRLRESSYNSEGSSN